MSRIDILVPDLPESTSNAIIVSWKKKPGDIVIKDEILLEIETDKIMLEIPSPTDGILDIILKNQGSIVTSKQILGYLFKNKKHKKKLIETKKKYLNESENNKFFKENINYMIGPSARRILSKYNIKENDINKFNIQNLINSKNIDSNITKRSIKKNDNRFFSQVKTKNSIYKRTEKRIPMTYLRKCIAERLLKSKLSTAMLTTFNEVNMKPIIDIRKKYGEIFEKRHGVSLGLMSFYVKTVAEALKRYPEVNAIIDGNDIVYYNYFDISIAISTQRGLVTPVIRDVNTLSIVDIERIIKELTLKGFNNKLTIEDLSGGNFTITNGGIFGSLMSTPIINPPQSAILGVHVIKDRPIVVNGNIEILPMVYLALSYDHRLIDGKESIGFLLTIKKLLEDPNLFLIDL